jgi:hypothetical protein
VNAFLAVCAGTFLAMAALLIVLIQMGCEHKGE